jgi:uncharacterized protein YneR
MSGNVAEAVVEERGASTLWRKTDKPLPAHAEINVTPEVLSRYVGEYKLAPGFILTVTVEGGRIFTQATGQEKVEVYAESETKFFLKVVEASIEFVKDDTGKFSKLILRQGGQTIEGNRVQD